MLRLDQVLPKAEFTEHHERIIAAEPDLVWAALRATQWSDLRWTMPFMAVRGLGRARRLGAGGVLDSGPCPVIHEEPGRYAVGGFIGRPWQVAPERSPRVQRLEELTAFAEPGWLVCAMDFAAHPLPGGRTRLTTTTMCSPTDDVARRRFAPYWRLIRPFSGLIRRDLLRAVAARSVPGVRPA